MNDMSAMAHIYMYMYTTSIIMLFLVSIGKVVHQPVPQEQNQLGVVVQECGDFTQKIHQELKCKCTVHALTFQAHVACQKGQGKQ